MLAAVTAVIASSFLFRSAQEAKLAGRTLLQSVALNLAEAGVEEGLYAANTSGFTAANGWTLAAGSSTDYVKSITTGFDFQQATGAVYIRVDAATSLAPVVIATGVVDIPNQPRILKQIRVAGSKRHLWVNGIVSRGTLTFSGNAVINSYDSSLGPYNAATNRSDAVTVASASTAVDPVVVGSNASIYGYVATTGADPVVGTGGRIYGATTPEGTNVDPSRIRRDFTSNFPDVAAPTGTAISLGAVSSATTLPRVGDTPDANGRYLYTATSVNIAGTSALAIKGPVDVVVTGSFAVSGGASVTVGGVGSTNPSLNLYCASSVSLAGNGLINNTADASKTTIWGTAASSTPQTVLIAGNGAFTGTIYAPNGNLTMAGNGDTSGAIIGLTVTVAGNGQFHYDTQLAAKDTSVDASYRLSSWCELSGAPGGGSAFARDNRQPFSSLY